MRLEKGLGKGRLRQVLQRFGHTSFEKATQTSTTISRLVSFPYEFAELSITVSCNLNLAFEVTEP